MAFSDRLISISGEKSLSAGCLLGSHLFNVRASRIKVGPIVMSSTATLSATVVIRAATTYVHYCFTYLTAIDRLLKASIGEDGPSILV